MKIVGYARADELMVGALNADATVCELGQMRTFWRSPYDAMKSPGAKVQIAPHELRPAVPPTARVICIGLNYRLHAKEGNLPIPTIPVVFGRWPNTLTVDGVPAPAIDEKFDWECELGVIVGRRMFRVEREEALKGVFGYCAFNDLSARTFQMQTTQWTLGKNSEASGPMSPVVTVDEAGDPGAGLRIMTRVNGETMQDSTTADMIFNVQQIIAHLSQAMTLEPGDLIVTGTPSGVGFARGVYLKPGDTVEVEIETIGRVRTPIIAPPAPIRA